MKFHIYQPGMSAAVRSFFFVLMVLLMAGISQSAMATDAPTIMTDKPDYAPGETAYITGSNWMPGETVMMVIDHTFDYHPNDTLYAVATESGDIATTLLYWAG